VGSTTDMTGRLCRGRAVDEESGLEKSWVDGAMKIRETSLAR
jgi:hypothetical protein